MRRMRHIGVASLFWVFCMVCGRAVAEVPPPTPEQQQAAAAKKAQADALAEKEKQQLAASMDAVAARWREQAKSNGWPTHPPTPVAAKQGLDAPAAQSSASGQPEGKLGSAAKEAPIKSEKHGTAPPSTDVKQAPPNTKQ